jgi:hypothetical protein
VVSDGVLGEFVSPPAVEEPVPSSLLELSSAVGVCVSVSVDPASETTPPPGVVEPRSVVFGSVFEGPVSSAVVEELDPSLLDNELVSALVFEVVGVVSSVVEGFVSSAVFDELDSGFVPGVVPALLDARAVPVELLSVDPASEIAPPPEVVVSVGGALLPGVLAPGVDSTPPGEDLVSVDPILVDPASEITPPPGVVVSLAVWEALSALTVRLGSR